VYNEARKWVIASQQHIVINQWLPEWLGKRLDEYKGKVKKNLKTKSKPYCYHVIVVSMDLHIYVDWLYFTTGYDPSIDPQIDQFFQAAAFRFGHTLVPPGR
jgi:dual oxidase